MVLAQNWAMETEKKVKARFWDSLSTISFPPM